MSRRGRPKGRTWTASLPVLSVTPELRRALEAYQVANGHAKLSQAHREVMGFALGCHPGAQGAPQGVPTGEEGSAPTLLDMARELAPDEAMRAYWARVEEQLEEWGDDE